MNLSLVREKDNWNDFLVQNQGSFLQSFEWGEFQKKLSKKIYPLKIEKERKILAQALLIQEKLPFNKTYFYIPLGPVFNLNIPEKEREKAFELLLNEIKTLAEKENTIFLRIEPVFSLPEISGLNLKDSFLRVQPQKTLILDLEKSEEELSKNLHQKTRYNIKLAKRKGVKIKITDHYSASFLKLIKDTRERQEFHSYPEEYYKKLLEIGNKNFQIKLFLAEYKGEIIVASVVVFFGNRVSSLHTGSDYKYRIIKAPHLLRWQVILTAKKRGYGEYDFWGIDEKKWPGLTYFKKGFGGKKFEYTKGKDIIFQDKWYNIYKITKKILLK